MSSRNHKQNYRFIPNWKLGVTVLIVILIVLSIFITVVAYNRQAQTRLTNETADREQVKKEILKPTTDDHVYGADDAKVQFVLYSDIHCQYCRSAYPKLKRVVDFFPLGTVSLVYRHIPIIYTHTEPTRAEIASECAARDLDDEGFYRFLDLIFDALPANQQLKNVSDDLIVEVAEKMQIDATDILACVDNGYHTDKIMADYKSGGALGIVILPHAFLVSELGAYPISRDQSDITYINAVQYILDNPKE